MDRMLGCMLTVKKGRIRNYLFFGRDTGWGRETCSHYHTIANLLLLLLLPFDRQKERETIGDIDLFSNFDRRIFPSSFGH
mmetsp:Transcript_38856/g.42114  ORF Transcript_38856/g.42114 Transcript_38856/m.42114 type:complete len:80 (+) Transcript_38856:551-790(+)